MVIPLQWDKIHREMMSLCGKYGIEAVGLISNTRKTHSTEVEQVLLQCLPGHGGLILVVLVGVGLVLAALVVLSSVVPPGTHAHPTEV